ncbi:MAG: tetratricopeptide repeat protein [Pseudomonadales bacterium]|nr:tetratricopeptide repeat protein [Pseudomonadales bacterium]
MALIRSLRCATLVVVLLAASSANAFLFWGGEEKQKEGDVMTLGQLIALEVSPTYDLVQVSTDEQIEVYRKVLDHVSSQELTAKVLARIADLELMLQDQKVVHSEAEAESGVGSEEIYVADYTIAIEAYKTALQRYPDLPNNDKVLYQLAKAYDLSAMGSHNLGILTQLVNKYPESRYYVESQFRRGDLLFSTRRFPEALQAYQAVLDGGQTTAYYENAIYMHGWSLFKLEDYDSAYASFTQVLDLSIPKSGKLEDVPQSKTSLVDDSLRILSIMFSYQSGGNTIAATYEKLGHRSYEGVIYRSLGDLYVTQERYQDAISTYKEYIQREPFSDAAPMLQNEIIKTMRIGRLFDLIFPEKELFVKSYQLDTEYYDRASLDNRRYIRAHLYVYLDEVARFYHTKAQRVTRRYKVIPPKYSKIMRSDYARAVELYDQFIETFRDDVNSSEKSFLKAGALVQLGDYRQAIAAYEATAYDYPLSVFSEEAAYAGILAYRKLLKAEENEEQRELWVKEKLNAQLAFGDMYAFSQFARPVLLDSIDLLYSEKRYKLAVEQADIFLGLKPAGSDRELLTIWTVKAHSNFELKNYQQAELDYKKTLDYLNKKDKRYVIMVDQMAASVYKQGEALAAEGKKLEAVEQLLRVATIAPNSKHRKVADYDAATYLLQAEEWERAIGLVNAYRKRFDPTKTDLDITGKLILAYEGLERYSDAAAELMRVYRDAKDAEKRRQALFLAAEYYEKADDDKRALATFKKYAHQYPQPFDLAIETQFRISGMYKKMGDDYRRRFWLEKVIVANRDAGEASTTRSKYLAAFARNLFADDKFKAYVAIELTWPIADSLGRKRTAMDDLLKRYQQIMAYGVQEFSTQSQYKVATIYADLGAKLLDSEHPPGMDELEAEEYEYLLEDEAIPFEEQAVEIHEANVQNSWNGNYDEWVGKSMKALGELLPGRYNKQEVVGEYSATIY